MEHHPSLPYLRKQKEGNGRAGGRIHLGASDLGLLLCIKIEMERKGGPDRSAPFMRACPENMPLLLMFMPQSMAEGQMDPTEPHP